MKENLNNKNISNLIKKAINETLIRESNQGVSADVFQQLWNNFPNAAAYEIFPGIMPKQYNASPETFGNACATRMSMAMNMIGKTPPQAFRTENDWFHDGIMYSGPVPITTSAIRTPPYLKKYFGPPTYVFENTMENVKKYLNNKNAFFVITGVPGWRASGHVDILKKGNNSFVCKVDCHFGEGGKVQAWVANPDTSQGVNKNMRK